MRKVASTITLALIAVVLLIAGASMLLYPERTLKERIADAHAQFNQPAKSQ